MMYSARSRFMAGRGGDKGRAEDGSGETMRVRVSGVQRERQDLVFSKYQPLK